MTTSNTEMNISRSSSSAYIPIVCEAEIPESIDSIVQTMGSRIHDSWAHARMSNGWTYGPERNDERKEHPCLVPWEKLSDEEKSYDLITARATISILLSNKDVFRSLFEEESVVLPRKRSHRGDDSDLFRSHSE